MSQGDRVYERLREDIVEWRLPPGAPLGESDLAERLEVSRTPLRAAIQRLAHEGLVVVAHGRGASVADISLDNVVKLFQMREALESYAVRLCARQSPAAKGTFERLRVELEAAREELRSGQVSDEYRSYYRLIGGFDDAVDAGADNPYLLSALRDLRGHLHRLRRIARRRPDRMVTTADEHLAICRAICDGDEVLAAQAVAVHIHNSLRNILTALTEDVAGPALLGVLQQPPAAPSAAPPAGGHTPAHASDSPEPAERRTT
ncbi:GntR family transcriptional regulator [Streptomyces sp. NPDC050560]|uniref:GntR family transcriptional regulator n=1 Tax=Streptomyces sp. NPDC050560 TaxID=3365630 RepID=UPI0037B8F7F5